MIPAFSASTPPSTVFANYVFKPQTLVPGNNIYNTWSSLYADLIANPGVRNIIFDNTDDAYINPLTCLIPAGTWNMQGVTFVGFQPPSGGVADVEASNGCILQNFFTVGAFVALTSSSLAPVCTITGGSPYISIGFESLVTSNTNFPFYAVNGGSTITVVLADLASISSGGSSGAFALTASTMLSYLGVSSNVDADSITGDASSLLYQVVAVGSATLGGTQTGFLGTIVSFLADRAQVHSYDGSISGFFATDVQGALDEEYDQREALKSLYDYVTMTTAGSYLVQDYSSGALLHSTGTIVAFTVTLPVNVYDGQLMFISSDHIVTTFTLNAGSGRSFAVAPVTTLAVGSTLRFRYSATDSKWWPV